MGAKRALNGRNTYIGSVGHSGTSVEESESPNVLEMVFHTHEKCQRCGLNESTPKQSVFMATDLSDLCFDFHFNLGCMAVSFVRGPLPPTL